jgi:two-component system, chemotaxis family, CheB/CheR fusion protein
MTQDSSDQKTETPHESHPNDFIVVGLGASAGGIQALKHFFAEVPEDSGIAYVVILHMSPEHESRLAEILQSTSPIPVTQVSERVKVEPNHVYVIPPSHNLAMTDGHLALTTMIGTHERRSPVDLFFRTLANANDSRAVSVILSGTGANGSLGLKQIKEAGGVAFAQDPAEAEYSDMPQNAIATGLVDYILPVKDIPPKILSYKAGLGKIMIHGGVETPLDDEQALREIFIQLRRRTGHDFSNYKRPTMLRRVERRLRLKELATLQEYAKLIKEDPDESKSLMKDLLISVTNFFRDPDSIEALANRVIPDILANKREDDFLRVWVAGCATGEEAFTVAITLLEATEKLVHSPQLQVFASDLDADAIAIAREGYYTEAEVSDVSPERLRRFFVKDFEGYRVRKEIREVILFAAHNIIKDPPFSHLDLISCRNLLIYLNRSAQTRILEAMHFALNSGGYLFLGASESIEGATDFFSTVDKEHHIFQSRPVPTRAIFPIPDIGFAPPTIRIDKQKTQQEIRAMERLEYVDLHQRLLEQFAPPSLIVNQDYEIVHLSDRVGRYLQVSGGEPTNNLLRLIRPELRLELRTALYNSVQNRIAVETPSVEIPTDGSIAKIRMSVRSVFRETDATRGFILVLFREDDELSPEPPTEVTSRSSEPLAAQLEEELSRVKGQLRATVEQYEIQQEELRASNEELQAINEELRSSTEELETSKEELQSINEELSTVNQELKIKIEELSQANNDFTNLMNSTDIGTIFLDRGLRVKMFTPRARDAFNLISTDINRPLLHIAHKLTYKDLEDDIERVRQTLHTLEREVTTTDQRWYVMRILPYRTAEDRIDGLVLTFVDISAIKSAESELEDARGQLEVKVQERTSDLRTANLALSSEVDERRKSEVLRAKLLKQLVEAQEGERRRLSRELHDQLGQQMTALRLKLETLKGETKQRKKLGSDIDELLDITEQLDSDIDFLAWELRPRVLDDLGLSEALRVYVDRWAEHFKVAAQFHMTGLNEHRLSPELENHFYRTAQEALNNVAKHSQATKVDVLLERRGTYAVLIIEDNGVGFKDLEQSTRTMGLTGMQERAKLLDGTFEIESKLNEGTTIFVRVPIQGKTNG